eukprot:scaffold7890_cov112-Isochrysis_galbana.AAC.6
MRLGCDTTPPRQQTHMRQYGRQEKDFFSATCPTTHTEISVLKSVVTSHPGDSPMCAQELAGASTTPLTTHPPSQGHAYPFATGLLSQLLAPDPPDPHPYSDPLPG